MCRAMDAINGGRIDGEIQVGRFLLDHHFEKRANIHEMPLSNAVGNPFRLRRVPVYAAPPAAALKRLGFMLRD